MCKAPKVRKPESTSANDKPVQYLRNPYLDGAIGLGSTVDQLRRGRSSLRIDLGSNNLAIRPPTPPGIRDPSPGPRQPLPKRNQVALIRKTDAGTTPSLGIRNRVEPMPMTHLY